MKLNSKEVALIGVLAALITVVSAVRIPVGTIPVTMQTLSLLLVAAIVPFKISMWATVTYLFILFIGLPVDTSPVVGFARFTKDNPAFGFLYGFLTIPAMFAVAKKFTYKLSESTQTLIGGLLATISLYVVGTFMAYFIIGGSESFGNWSNIWAWFVSPFLLGDSLKLMIVVYLAPKLIDALDKNSLPTINSNKMI